MTLRLRLGLSQSPHSKNGLGLVLTTPTGRFRTLYNKKGLTAAGKYYYETTGINPPGQFDFQQDAYRKGNGRSQYIKLLDGSERKVSTWDNVNREWKLTALARTFFAKAIDCFVCSKGDAAIMILSCCSLVVSNVCSRS